MHPNPLVHFPHLQQPVLGPPESVRPSDRCSSRVARFSLVLTTMPWILLCPSIHRLPSRPGLVNLPPHLAPYTPPMPPCVLSFCLFPGEARVKSIINPCRWYTVLTMRTAAHHHHVSPKLIPPSFPGSSVPCLCLLCFSSSHSRHAVQLLLLPLPLLLPPLYAYIGRNPPLLAAALRPARSNSIHEYLHGSVDAR